MREERLNFRYPHLVGMAIIVEKDVATNPLDVGFFSSVRVVFEANRISNLVEELFGWVFHGELSPYDSKIP
jgi:hypothetical protein